MRVAIRTAAVSTLALLLALGCSSDDPYDPGGGNPNQSSMSGTIDGAAWTATIINAARSGSATITVSVSGRDAQNRQIDLTLVGATGTGTFSVGSGQPLSATFQFGDQAWAGHLSGASGSITLTTLTSTHMVGSYNITLVPLTSSATGNRVIVGTFTAHFGQT